MSSAPCAWAIRPAAALKPSRGATTPMLPAAASVMTAAMCGPSRGEGRLDRGDVVVGQHDRLAGRRAGHAGRVGQAEGGHAGAGGGEQRVDVPVVAAGELDDLGAAGEAAGQPDRRHGRLGARVDQAYLLDRGPRDDLGGQLDLARGGGAEAGAPGGGRLRPPRPPRGGRGRGSAAPRSRPGRRSGGRRRRTASGPSPRTMNRGVPPTARNARTGEFTPPGTMARARSNRACGGRRVGRVAAGSGGNDVGHDAAIVSAPDGQPAATPGRGYRAHPARGVRSGRLDSAARGLDRPGRPDRDRLTGWIVPNCPSRVHRTGDEAVLRLAGEIDMLTAAQLSTVVNEVLADPPPRIVLDLGRRHLLRLAGPGHARRAQPQGQPRAEPADADQRGRLPAPRPGHHRPPQRPDDPQRPTNGLTPTGPTLGRS